MRRVCSEVFADRATASVTRCSKTQEGEGRMRDDRGEGVISAAIAVLIMAAIGALMWVGFEQIWKDAEQNTRDKVAEIGT